MTAAIVALLAIVPGQGDERLGGVFVTDDSMAFVLCGQVGTFVKDGRFGMLEFDRNTPSGEIWYVHAESRIPELQWREPEALPLLGKFDATKEKNGSHAILVPENAGSYGWWRFKWGGPGVSYGNFSMDAASGRQLMGGRVTRIASTDGVYADGVYKDSSVTLSLTSEGGNLTGSLKYKNMNAILEGEYGFIDGRYLRVGSTWKKGAAIGHFRLVDYQSGSSLGSGLYCWAGSARCVADLRAKKRPPADQVLLYFKLNDNRSLVNGFTGLLTRIDPGGG